MLSLTDVRVTVEARPTPVLDGLTLTVERGQMVALMGPSGSGKSTTLDVISGLRRPDEGSVAVDDEVLTSLSDRALAKFRRTRLGLIFQSAMLLPELTVLENVMLPSLLDGASRRSAREEALRRMTDVELPESVREEHRPSTLSGGEAQRVAVARALMGDPDILLCDEPTASLDRANADKVTDLLVRTTEAYQCATIVATHDIEVARRCSATWQLEDGRVALTAATTGAT